MIEGEASYIANSQLGHEGRLAAQPTREPLDSVRNSNPGSLEDATQVRDASLGRRRVGSKVRHACGRTELVSTPSQPCRFFASYGHCRHEDRCRYSHDVTGDLSDSKTHERKDAAKPGCAKHEPSSAVPSEVCRFYERTGYCGFGRRCRYLHRPKTKNARRVHKTALTCEQDQVVEPNSPQDSSTHAEVKGANLTSNQIAEGPPKHVSSPNCPDQEPERELTEEEILKELRAREVEQFRKRYRRCRKIATDEENGEKFSFVFQPTDPDWPFDVKELSLLVSFPQSYPKEYFTLHVLDEDAVLPPILLRDLNRAVASWLLEKHAANQRLGQTQLILRPFLRWFDRNLERLFVEGLRKVKKMQLAEAAGLEFVPFEQLAPKADDELSDTLVAIDTPQVEMEKAKDVQVLQCNNSSWNEVGERHTEVVLNRLSCGSSKAQESSIKDAAELQDTSHDDSAKMGKSGDHGTEVQVTGNELGDKPARSLDEKRESTAKLDDSAKLEQLDSQRPRADILVNQKRGTEVKFRRLELGESVATLECLKVALRIQCSRCRCNADLTTPPRRRNVVTCGRCSQSGALTFRPNLMHAFNSVLGYLDMTDYQVVDLVLSGCIFAVECFGCNKRISTDGIHYGQRRSLWCQFCNAKMVVLMESIKFQQLQPTKATEGGPGFSVKTPKAVKNVKDPAIQEGKPLPSGGICKHYKKSFRWLRFPCCGKAYPCDKCHEEHEGGHEMKFATRMICGHCAKEQPFAAEKSCTSCGSFMTKKPTAHWEGGRGCRDSIKMSRDDNKKYSGISKTISRKAQDKVTGKK